MTENENFALLILPSTLRLLPYHVTIILIMKNMSNGNRPVSPRPRVNTTVGINHATPEGSSVQLWKAYRARKYPLPVA